MCNSTFSSDALYSEQSVFSFEASWAAVGLIRLWACMSCGFSNCNMNKNGFHISSRKRFFYEASFVFFVVISILYELRDKETLFHFSQSFLLSLFFPFLIFCRVFPVQFMSSYKAICGSYKLSTHHNHPVLVAAE
jgi:dolichyl-phosphate-mannose--protein O-mannosyl transferase